MQFQASPGSQAVQNLQSMLRTIAYDQETPRTVIPDGVYGTDTTSAVSDFQREHGLPITGVADQQTWDALVIAYDEALVNSLPAQSLDILFNSEEDFENGQKASYLRLAQTMLCEIAKKYKCICQPEINGRMDDMTIHSLSDFQQICDLPMTGKLSKATWKHLVLHYPGAAEMETY